MTKEEKAQKNRERVRQHRLKTKKLCPECGDKWIMGKSKTCRLCIKTERKWEDITIRDAIYEKHHRSSAFALIRSRARAVARKLNKLTCCQKCGYDKHVEVCHIKAIKDFDLDTSLDIVNDPENLLFLCPNCHWEFDNS